MKVNSAVLLVLFVLVAVFGWFAASSASPKLVTLLMGVAIGVIVTMPITLVVARILWSEELRAMKRRERRQRGHQRPRPMTYPPVIVVSAQDQDVGDYSRPVAAPRRGEHEPPLIHYLGEE